MSKTFINIYNRRPKNTENNVPHLDLFTIFLLIIIDIVIFIFRRRYIFNIFNDPLIRDLGVLTESLPFGNIRITSAHLDV